MITLLFIVSFLPLSTRNTVPQSLGKVQSSSTALQREEIVSYIAYLSHQPVYGNAEPQNRVLSGEGVITASVPVLTEINPKNARSDIQTYRAQPGDTLSGIASKFGVSLETIIWANNLEYEDVKIGQELLVLPVSGVYYEAQAGDTVASTAAKFKANAAIVAEFNDLEGRAIQSGMKLIIPGGSKDWRLKARAAAPAAPSAPSSPVRRGWGGTGSVFRTFFKSGGRFPGGWCTSWVELNKGYIPWLGDAKYWPSNAQRVGVATGSVPRAGAIYAEPWLTWWGHVSLVTQVNSDGSFVVTEGNGPGGGYGLASARTVPAGAGGIFIYY